MNKLNLPPFLPNDVVVANCTFAHIMQGHKYVVEACYWDCCAWLVVTKCAPPNRSTSGRVLKIGDIIGCDACKQYVPNRSLKLELLSTRFSPLQKMKFKPIRLAKLVELEESLCEN